MKNAPFTAAQMRQVIEGKQAGDRIPMIYNFWSSPSVFGENKEKAQQLLNEYPCDAQIISIRMPDINQAPDDDPDYKFLYKTASFSLSAGLDAQVFLEDWSDLDDIIAHFPNPDYVNLFPHKGINDSRYKIAHWWYCFFERLWSLRGMENALTDFYLYPDEVHKFFDKLCDFYMRIIERCKSELLVDAIFTSDDIGTQNAPFFFRRNLCGIF